MAWKSHIYVVCSIALNCNDEYRLSYVRIVDMSKTHICAGEHGVRGTWCKREHTHNVRGHGWDTGGVRAYYRRSREYVGQLRAGRETCANSGRDAKHARARAGSMSTGRPRCEMCIVSGRNVGHASVGGIAARRDKQGAQGQAGRGG